MHRTTHTRTHTHTWSRGTDDTELAGAPYDFSARFCSPFAHDLAHGRGIRERRRASASDFPPHQPSSEDFSRGKSNSTVPAVCTRTSSSLLHFLAVVDGVGVRALVTAPMARYGLREVRSSVGCHAAPFYKTAFDNHFPGVGGKSTANNFVMIVKILK